jgi:hypothetical protein
MTIEPEAATDFLVEALLRVADCDAVNELCNEIGPLLERHSNATSMCAIAMLLANAADSTPDGLAPSVVLAVVKRLAEHMIEEAAD